MTPYQAAPMTRVIVANVLTKLTGYSAVLLLWDTWLSGLYASLIPLFATVLVLTAVGAVADLTVLPLLGNVVSLLIGAEGMVFLIYVVPLMWPASDVTLLRAIGMALCIAPIEFVLHRFVLRGLFNSD
ncbi:hypothetical protein GCM10025857_13950 [Alicyclobacillus contaminans]|uniref:DUF2512 family protein n=1 Tax=Alicyclobacillus contaminans TaxID=392016 RepID=UPI00042976AD|nr:DUF2512 family protein [Alicyclobacillus contaminans]GMA50038.1 hypothetical protein GCM10025857_13950 [Alicyclobacillus contaminans]